MVAVRDTGVAAQGKENVNRGMGVVVQDRAVPSIHRAEAEAETVTKEEAEVGVRSPVASVRGKVVAEGLYCSEEHLAARCEAGTEQASRRKEGSLGCNRDPTYWPMTLETKERTVWRGSEK